MTHDPLDPFHINWVVQPNSLPAHPAQRPLIIVPHPVIKIDPGRFGNR